MSYYMIPPRSQMGKKLGIDSRYEKEKTNMATFKVYYEQADGNEPKQYIARVSAESMANALQIASVQFQVPEYDLVAEQEFSSIDRIRTPQEEYRCQECQDQGCIYCMDSIQLQF